MILKFPKPYPDETFYSWIARYHDQSANGLYKFTAMRLYGETPTCAIYGLPTGLRQFCENLLPLQIYSPEDVIKTHTLLPYYSSAVPKQRIRTVKERMLGSANTGIHGKLGTLTTDVKNFQYLRYCPACLDDDAKHMGEPYWHRTHQLPGVLVCPFHNVPTLNSKVDKQAHHHLLYASASLYAQPNIRQSKVKVCDKLGTIAEDSSALLKSYRRLVTVSSYRTALLNNGFNQGKYLDQDKLAKAFVDFWTPEVLESVGALPDLDKHHWLRRITTRNRNGPFFPPLYHVLLRTFLSHSTDSCSTNPAIPQVRRQYPCPNPFCSEPDSKSAVLCRTHRNQKTGPLHGTITCNCGFSFSCNLEKDNYYTGHVISYGSVWDNTFKEFVKQGFSIPQMMEAMSVSHRVIVRKALELGLSPGWGAKMERKPGRDKYINDRIIKERGNLLAYLKAHPNQSRSEIKSGMNAGYKFLYRRDKEWLLNHLPSARKPKPKNLVINWKKRDRNYLQQVKSIVRDLLQQPGKPVRITPSLISKMMGKRNLFTKISLEKIPRTAAYIQESCSENDYFRRRFNWAREQLIKKGQTITRSNLIYTACLSYNLTSSQESIIRELLDAENEESYSLPQNQAPKA